jgi:hypothetical protein
MTRVNLERATFWKDQAEQNLKGIVEQYKSPDGFKDPLSLSNNYLYALYQEAAFSGKGEEPLPRRIAEVYLSRQPKRIKILLGRLAADRDPLPDGEEENPYIEISALFSLAAKLHKEAIKPSRDPKKRTPIKPLV